MFIGAVGLAALSAVFPGAARELGSPAVPPTVIELFTSEGCSSCPPADRYLADFVDDPGLWRRLVPVAFHVDYWDRLGWPDRFAKAIHSARQRRYARAQGAQVYTPGFFVDGREWRGFFGDRELPGPTRSGPYGTLRVTLKDKAITARYEQAPGTQKPAAVTVIAVLLGFGLETEVARGENAGKTLSHDFVVLGIAEKKTTPGSDAVLELEPPDITSKRHALAVWAVDGEGTYLQAAADWLSAADTERLFRGE